MHRENNTTQDAVNRATEKLVVEINEFLTVLFANSSSDEERQILSKIKKEG
jgi:hypothetical protein